MENFVLDQRHICWLIYYWHPFTSGVDAGLGISAKTSIVGGFYDEEKVGACTPILDMGSPDAKQITSWFFIA